MNFIKEERHQVKQLSRLLWHQKPRKIQKQLDNWPSQSQIKLKCASYILTLLFSMSSACIHMGLLTSAHLITLKFNTIRSDNEGIHLKQNSIIKANTSYALSHIQLHNCTMRHNLHLFDMSDRIQFQATVNLIQDCTTWAHQFTRVGCAGESDIEA